VRHELKHFRDFRKQLLAHPGDPGAGVAAFDKISTTALEQSVYDTLRGPRRWPLLNLAEQADAQYYIAVTHVGDMRFGWPTQLPKWRQRQC